MKLTLHLVAALPGQAETTAHVAGDVLVVDGTPHDLAAVPEGGRAWPAGIHPFSGPITRKNGEIHAALRWHYDGRRAQPEGRTHPVVGIAEGAIPDPLAPGQEDGQEE